MNIFSFLLKRETRTRKKLGFYLSLKNKSKKNILDKLFINLLYDNLYIKNSIIIGKESNILNDICFPHLQNIVIGEGVMIGKNCTIFQGVTLGQNRGRYPILGDNVIVYAGAKIVGDVYIGKNSIIGANAVVVKSVPDNAIVGGVPAKVIGFRGENDEFY